MPLTDPIGEPLIEEVESLIPELAPTKHSLLPGIKTNKPLLYPIPGESENSEQLNLIETSKGLKSEFSRAEADAFIINQTNDINSIPSANTSPLITNSTLRDATNSEVDPLIGKLDSDLGDPLTNPNRIASNNSTDNFNKSAIDVPAINSSISTSELLNKTTTATTITPDNLPVNPITVSNSAQSEPNQTSSTTASTSDRSEFNKTLPATVSTTDTTEPNKTSPTITSTPDKSESNKTLLATI
ncbi:hypothetical protein QUB63_32335 [Microcoleus sp. ARI1-B5]|uniref:hypothetical protein n=1 Tax=unclassified Microcoleus TaxID=2642155 RepID=UPI002FD2BABA